ncbi:hypothetical protein ACX80N_08835 [Arthrobacter sp. MDT2-16]
MIPDEPAPAPMPHKPPQHPDDGGTERSSGVRRVILGLAVALAAIGLLSLAAILATAFVQGTVWPGFVLATYFCLPIAFLLMVSLVVWSAISRRDS